MQLIATSNHTSSMGEARRVMEICNACRYCEGYCAVFQSMSRRRDFSDGDLEYLANLCHNCTACYHACQYAPPHEFDLNVPRALAELRAETYEKYAWPLAFAKLFRRNGLFVSLAAALSLTLVLLVLFSIQNPQALWGTHQGAGAFYRVISYQVMVGGAGAVFAFVLLALGMGIFRFWKGIGLQGGSVAQSGQWIAAIHDVLTLKHLGGGGHGCNTEDASFSNIRRGFHQVMMYGFLLCFAATAVATLYDHLLGLQAPYPLLSLPVVLGTLGGIGLLVGPAGMLWAKLNMDGNTLARRFYGMDVAFLALLFLTSLTGLTLLGFRETQAMGMLLAIHLGFVLALFLVLPYSKFVHAGYRFAALIKFAGER